MLGAGGISGSNTALTVSSLTSTGPITGASAAITNALTVGGASSFTGPMAINSSGGALSLNNGNLFVAGTGTYSNAVAINATGTALNVPNGNVVIGGILNAASAGFTGTLNANGATAIGSTLLVDGVGTFNGGMSYSNFGCYLTASTVQTTPASYTANIGIACTNGITSGGFFGVSDARLKTDIIDIDPEDGVMWVMSGRPRHYLKEGKPEAGFIAQEEIAAGRGEAVIQIPDDRPMFAESDGFADAGHRLAMSYENNFAYMTAAMQGMLKRIAVLEEQLRNKAL